MSGPPPHNLEAEASLLGACLISPQQVEPCAEIAVAGDFYKPSYGNLWQAIVEVHGAGTVPDAVAVAEEMRREGTLEDLGGSAEIVALQRAAAATSTAPEKARIVAGLSAQRELIGVAEELRERASGAPEGGAAGLMDWAVARVNEVDVGRAQVPSTFSTMRQFLDRPEDERAPWVIPGQLRRRWRAILVSEEGVGKSTILKQIALLVAQGFSPFAPSRRIEPVRSLIIDCENPDEAIEEQALLVYRQLWAQAGDAYDPSMEGLLRQEDGLDLRTRRDRAMVEAVLSHFRPNLVVAGPIYKLYRRRPGERGHEEGVSELQNVFDRWRRRFDFALILEHHAPMAKNRRGERELRPSDTMLWLRWPEYGFALSGLKNEEGKYRLSRWRGDRLQATWPTTVFRGATWPWEFSWPTGTFSGPPQDEIF